MELLLVVLLAYATMIFFFMFHPDEGQKQKQIGQILKFLWEY